MYIFQSSVPENDFKTTEDARSFMKKYLGKNAFLRRLTDLRPDDIFVYSEPEELIRPEILRFLKLYDGYTEPITFQFRRSVFGYFWTADEENFGPHHMLLQDNTKKPSAASLALFRDFYHYDASFHGFIDDNKTQQLKDIKRHDEIKTKQFELAKEDFESRTDIQVRLFNIADDAGWKCLWCHKPEGIRNKLLNIPPKYLDMVSLMIQENSELEHIRGFIKYGVYFDKAFMRGGKGTELTRVQDIEFAPTYIQEDFNRFSYLLVNPFGEKEERIPEVKPHSTIAPQDKLNTTNYSMIDALDDKIKKYWYSLFNLSSTNANHTLSGHIDNKFQSYWNSIRNQFLPSYIKWTQQ